jgi:hypothetical protein
MKCIRALLAVIALLLAVQIAAPAAAEITMSASEPCASMCAGASDGCGQHCPNCPDMALGCRASASCATTIAVAPANANLEEPGFPQPYFRPLAMMLRGRSIEPEQHPPSS